MNRWNILGRFPCGTVILSHVKVSFPVQWIGGSAAPSFASLAQSKDWTQHSKGTHRTKAKES